MAIEHADFAGVERLALVTGTFRNTNAVSKENLVLFTLLVFLSFFFQVQLLGLKQMQQPKELEAV